MLAFASRNAKEILRERLNLAFGIGFPVIVLLLLNAIQSRIPVALFEIEYITPGIAVFGLSFISLFSGMLIAGDRASSFMLRLFMSPLTAGDFILGYTLPLLPIAMAQVTVCFLVAFLLGLPVTIQALFTVVAMIPAALLFIGIGLLCGSLFNEKLVSGLCGALLTNLSAWLSGTWFDVDLVGGWFKKIADTLPFIHAVNAGRSMLAGDTGAVMRDLWWVIGYAAAVLALAIWAFTKQMRSDSK